ncbi:hypothetical protein RAK27_15595 [Carnobacterium maltaromaticum]|uniref:DUF4352 domain-containing protein n=1 Tax=Carnobacterium maltaromaticum TaxID=2751 RepID=A0AAW9JXP4_CARML|nr:hypothetical protein [Carnobacterium maltaromaticum]MDZ5760059.1 hypothetical protein [Carnobacterium maltaromaticum]
MNYLKKISIVSFTALLSIIIVACGSSSNNADKNKRQESVSEKKEDTPTDQLTDLAVGSSVTIKGVTITLNSVNDGLDASGSPTYEIDVTYKNNSEKNINASPYDWSTVLNTGSDKAHVGGKSFNTKSISTDEEWNGTVTLWKDESPEKVKFESSFLNIKGENSQVTWLITTD